MSSRYLFLILTLSVALACGGDTKGDRPSASGHSSQAGGQRQAHPGQGGPGGGSQQAAAVPVEVAPVSRRDISSFIETNGIIEAENEVDIVSRLTGPIVTLRAEEGMLVSKGQLLARIDDQDLRSSVEIARVALEEARLTYERSKKLHEGRLISPEEYEQSANRFETAQAQYRNNQILLGYTEIKAPFSGHIISRYVDLAQQVNPGSQLFRISDFDPLLCPIQVPERELPRLAAGQSAYLTIEAWELERFPASVLRVSPVVDAATGTVKVTLHVQPDSRLRPGMFTRVFLETERRQASLVIPKTALSLESLGDTVYVAENGSAARRDVTLGFREGDFVEVVDGLSEGESIVVVGQDGLSDGTPIQIFGAHGPAAAVGDPSAGSPETGERGPQAAAAPGEPGAGHGGPGRGRGRRMDPSQMTPEQLEQVKESMRARGLTEEEIEARLEQRKKNESQ